MVTDTHIVEIDVNPNTGNPRIANGGLSGGHNRDNFLAALENPRGLTPPIRAEYEVTSYIRDANGRIIGERIEYRIPKMDNQNVELDDFGNTVFLDEQPKSVYYPNVVSDSEMIAIARSAGEQFYERNYAEMLRRGPGSTITDVQTINGVDYTVYLKNIDGNIVVENVHIT